MVGTMDGAGLEQAVSAALGAGATVSILIPACVAKAAAAAATHAARNRIVFLIAAYLMPRAVCPHALVNCPD
jgi:Na+/H+ antiporter NhaC